MERLNVIYEGLNEDDINIFCDMLSYISPKIFSVNKEKNQVVLEVEDGYQDEVRNNVNDLRAMINSNEMKSNSRVKTKILKNFTGTILNQEPIFDELKDNGSIIEISKGAFIYSGIFLKVFKYFCRKIDEYGKKNFRDMMEYEVPVLFPTEIYEKGKYFENFPHHIMFQTTLSNDLKVLEEFSKNGTKDGKIFEKMKVPDLVLRHAACVPIYPILENKKIEGNQLPLKYMVSGKCFRNEGNNVFELARLNEFYMKEYVFVGTQEQVTENLGKGRKLWKYWIDLFGWKGTIETASDSFFASNYTKLKIFQMLGDSKQELRLELPASDMASAVSSTNVHRTHFTKEHNIRYGEAYCLSGCIAFGIDRLTYALLCQKGLDISKWDQESRAEIFDK